TNALLGSNYRYQYEELYLRVLAFSEKLDKYNGKLSNFLNDFMDDNRNPDDKKYFEWKSNFLNVLSLIYRDERIANFSKTIVEAILYGVYKNLNNVALLDVEIFKNRVNELREHENFSL